jgi:hypothetical protein
VKGTDNERKANEKELIGFKKTCTNVLHGSNSMETQIWEWTA